MDEPVGREARGEHERDPGKFACLNRERRDAERGHGDRECLRSIEALAQDHETEQDTYQWIDVVAETRRNDLIGLHGIDEQSPIARKQ